MKDFSSIPKIGEVYVSSDGCGIRVRVIKIESPQGPCDYWVHYTNIRNGEVYDKELHNFNVRYEKE